MQTYCGSHHSTLNQANHAAAHPPLQLMKVELFVMSEFGWISQLLASLTVRYRISHAPDAPSRRELQGQSTIYTWTEQAAQCGCAWITNQCSSPANALHARDFSRISESVKWRYCRWFWQPDWQYLELVGKWKLLTGSRFRGKITQVLKSQQHNLAGHVYLS